MSKGYAIGEDSANRLRKLRHQAEIIKGRLSTEAEVTLGEDFKYTKKYTRAEFERLNADLFERAVLSIDKVLGNAQIAKHEINDIILIGGSLSIPKLREVLSEYFYGKKPLVGKTSPDMVIACALAEWT